MLADDGLAVAHLQGDLGGRLDRRATVGTERMSQPVFDPERALPPNPLGQVVDAILRSDHVAGLRLALAYPSCQGGQDRDKAAALRFANLGPHFNVLATQLDVLPAQPLDLLGP